MKQTGKLISLLLLLSFVLSGCFGQSSKHIRGKVVLGDTDLGLWSTLTLGGHSLTTNDDGTFQVDLPAGNYNFQVSNLLGTFSGTVALKEGGTARLEVPTNVIPDWSIEAFNTFIVHGDVSQRTFRWPRYSTLNVWIDDSNPDVTSKARAEAFQAFTDWEDILNGLVSFKFVSRSSDAHITFTWDPNDPFFTGSIRGFCRFNKLTPSHNLQKVDIVIRHPEEVLRVYQHEVGHCLGIGHAYHIQQTTGEYDYVMGSGFDLTDKDATWMKLLYSIPTGTPRLPGDSKKSMAGRSTLPDHLNDIIYPVLDF